MFELTLMSSVSLRGSIIEAEKNAIYAYVYIIIIEHFIVYLDVNKGYVKRITKLVQTCSPM